MKVLQLTIIMQYVPGITVTKCRRFLEILLEIPLFYSDSNNMSLFSLNRSMLCLIDPSLSVQPRCFLKAFKFFFR